MIERVCVIHISRGSIIMRRMCLDACINQCALRHYVISSCVVFLLLMHSSINFYSL